MEIPKEILQMFKIDTPKIRGFYKHKKSKWLSESKTKYKICYEEIKNLNIFSFLITTSKDYSYSEYFSYLLSDIKTEKNLHWLENIWYINLWRKNELFCFIKFDEYSELYFSKQIEHFWYLSNRKFEELKRKIKANYNVKINFENSYKKLIPDIWNDFISKYKL